MGVIVKIENDAFRVLDNKGLVQLVRLQDMGTRRQQRHLSTSDVGNVSVRVNDLVRVVEGPHSGLMGTDMCF